MTTQYPLFYDTLLEKGKHTYFFIFFLTVKNWPYIQVSSRRKLPVWKKKYKNCLYMKIFSTFKSYVLVYAENPVIL